MPTLFLPFEGIELIKYQIGTFLRQQMSMAHWIRLSLLCRCEWTRKSQVWYGNVSEQYLLSCKNGKVYCVYRRSVSTQDSCACTRFLCMHKILVRAQYSCACTTLLCMHWRGQGPRPGPKKKAVHAQYLFYSYIIMIPARGPQIKFWAEYWRQSNGTRGCWCYLGLLVTGAPFRVTCHRLRFVM